MHNNQDHTTIQVVGLINSFDVYFESSESHDTYERGIDSENDIKRKIKNLTPEQASYVINNLTDRGKIAYERYFKNSIV